MKKVGHSTLLKAFKIFDIKNGYNKNILCLKCGLLFTLKIEFYANMLNKENKQHGSIL